MEFLVPWHGCSDSRNVDELRREITPGHFLENVDVSVVAYRQDRDDVLFALNDGSGRFAAVRLTYPKGRQTNPKVPVTRIFESHESWLEYMQAAHATWMAEEVGEDADGQLWLKEQRLWDSATRV